MSQSTEQKRRRGPTVTTLENVPQIDVPKNRGQEILRYLKLFGYKEDGSVLQVHVAGSFSAVSRRPREIAIKEKAAARYKDRTFTVLGRTHDPSILQKLIPPRSKRDASSRPGYLGYLWKEKDVDQKSPHEFIPLDFPGKPPISHRM